MGDALLAFLVSVHLFDKFPDADEAQLPLLDSYYVTFP
jgi:dsRNA-specific ribonuclease